MTFFEVENDTSFHLCYDFIADSLLLVVRSLTVAPSLSMFLVEMRPWYDHFRETVAVLLNAQPLNGFLHAQWSLQYSSSKGMCAPCWVGGHRTWEVVARPFRTMFVSLDEYEWLIWCMASETLGLTRMMMLYVATYALASLLQPWISTRRNVVWPVTAGDEEVCYAMWPAPVGTHSDGEPLPHHVGFAAQLMPFVYLHGSFCRWIRPPDLTRKLTFLWRHLALACSHLLMLSPCETVQCRPA